MKPLLIAVVVASSTILGAGCASYGSDKTDQGYKTDKAEQPGHNQRTNSNVVSDSIITTKVKSALLSAKDVNSLDISVETFDGAVQLAGFVESQWQIDQAIQIAAAVDGVVNVKSDLVKITK